MNTIKKIGLSALAGSLVAFSAQAGEVSVSGKLEGTYANKSAHKGTTVSTDQGKGFSTNTGLTFNASGEMDNGWTVSGFQSMNENMVGISSSQMSIVMGSMGKLKINRVGGGAVNALDDKLPTAWEESWDGSAHAFVGQTIGSTHDDGGISYFFPTIEESGMTIDIGVDYDPAAAVAAGGTGSTQVSGLLGTGMGVAVQIGTDAGLNAYAGMEQSERKEHGKAGDVGAGLADPFNMTGGVAYTIGAVTIGAQTWYNDQGDSTGVHYEADGLSIAFAVNEDLSLSYGMIDETKVANNVGTSNVEAEMESFNVAYSMGSMAVKAQHSTADNQDHALLGTSSRSEISLSLAF